MGGYSKYDFRGREGGSRLKGIGRQCVIQGKGRRFKVKHYKSEIFWNNIYPWMGCVDTVNMISGEGKEVQG